MYYVQYDIPFQNTIEICQMCLIFSEILKDIIFVELCRIHLKYQSQSNSYI